jgi:hypothetical protein
MDGWMEKDRHDGTNRRFPKSFLNTQKSLHETTNIPLQNI